MNLACKQIVLSSSMTFCNHWEEVEMWWSTIHVFKSKQKIEIQAWFFSVVLHFSENWVMRFSLSSTALIPRSPARKASYSGHVVFLVHFKMHLHLLSSIACFFVSLLSLFLHRGCILEPPTLLIHHSHFLLCPWGWHDTLLSCCSWESRVQESWVKTFSK